MLVLRLILLAPVAILALGAVLTLGISLWIGYRYPPRGSFVGVEGGRLHYVEKGPRAGPAVGTVVLVHGASGNEADMMAALGEHLAERHRVIAFDRPGHGWSDRLGGADAARPARQAAILAEGMRALGIRDAVVAGHSWGGSVVPNLALDHRDVTGAIVLVSAVTHPWPGGRITWYYHPAASILGWLFTRSLTTPLGLVFIEPAVRGVFAPEAAPPDYAGTSRIALVLRPGAFQANAEDVAGLYDSVAAQAPRYPGIRMPATVIGGDADTIVWTHHHSRLFAGAVPGAKLVILPGAGHMPHHTHAGRVQAEIEELAAGLRARGPAPEAAARSGR